MATYIEKSLVSTSKLSHITTSTMETIRNIDATVSKISLSLDDELSKMNDDNVCKIKALLRAIKVLDNRRVQLATHNYDLVDKHVQITDYNIKDMENVMKLHNTSVENSDSFETASHRNGPVVSTTEKNLESGSDPLSFHKNEPVYCTCKQVRRHAFWRCVVVCFHVLVMQLIVLYILHVNTHIDRLR